MQLPSVSLLARIKSLPTQQLHHESLTSQPSFKYCKKKYWKTFLNLFQSTTLLKCSAIKGNVNIYTAQISEAQIGEAHSMAYLRGWQTRGKQVLSAKTGTVHHNETAVTLLQTVKLCAAVGFGVLNSEGAERNRVRLLNSWCLC